MTIYLQRVYGPQSPPIGLRILVDRLWPRGISKEELHYDEWAKDLAPSTELRKWFAHDPAKWPEFRRRYFAELDANTSAVDRLRTLIGNRDVTFLYGARDEQHNEAVALRDYLQQKA